VEAGSLLGHRDQMHRRTVDPGGHVSLRLQADRLLGQHLPTSARRAILRKRPVLALLELQLRGLLKGVRRELLQQQDVPSGES